MQNFDKNSPFYFKDTMTEDVLRRYVSRAITHQMLCIDDPLFEEDMRMILNVGAKFIGRAAHFSWRGHMSDRDVEEHYEQAKTNAIKVHEADPEIILQAGVFEIIYRKTVENQKIPAWVFEAFQLPVEDRNFNWQAMCFPNDFVFGDDTWDGWGSPDFWAPEAAWPFIGSVETQMYYYYTVCRYIDAGFEAIHLGQAEKSTGCDWQYYESWDKVTTLARQYAKTHARRGIILFDAHTIFGSNSMRIGDKLIIDVVAAGMVPIDTVKEDGVLKCKICDYTENGCTWIGRSEGGKHPLGFNIDNCLTIIEFDNYGRPGPVGEYNETYTPWGYDDITWFAKQPEWYRNEFLLYCDNVLKTTRLDKNVNQVYFLQPQLKRILCCEGDAPECIYTPGVDFDENFFKSYTEFEGIDVEKMSDGSYKLASNCEYRANMQSDACPNGFNQEDIVKKIFSNPDNGKTV